MLTANPTSRCDAATKTMDAAVTNTVGEPSVQQWIDPRMTDLYNKTGKDAFI